MSKKMVIFSKELTHGFGPKMALFPPFFFQAIQARKIFFTILYIGKTPLQPIKTKSSKTPKSNIFPKLLTNSYGPLLSILPNFFFFAIQARKMSFTIFQKEKRPFQAINTRSSKSRKIAIIPKGLTHGFGPLMALFSTLFFKQYRPGKRLLRDS